MNCQEFVRFLEAMPLRERTPADMETLNQHAHQCLACAQQLLTTSKVEHDLSQLAFVNPPVDLSVKVMRLAAAAPSARLAPAKPRSDGLSWWMAGPIAALVAIPVCLYQAGLTTWLKQLVIPHASPQIAPSMRLLLAAEPGQWILGLAALLIGIVILSQREAGDLQRSLR